MSTDLIVNSVEEDAYAAFARVGAEENQGLGKILKMAKDGNWFAGPEEEPMTGAVLLADMHNLLVGWRKWVDGKVEASDVGRIMEGFVVKRREELGDDDRELWPFNKSGVQADPWQFGYTLRLASEDGEIYLYNATSFGGKGAIGNLCTQFSRRRSNPYVRLTSSSYKHKLYGRTFNPVLEIGGWEDIETADAPKKALPRGKITITSGKSVATPKSNFDDDTIPF
jgi:hypothetical protein